MPMGFDRGAAGDRLDKAGRVLTIGAVFSAVFLMLLRILVHFPIIDEFNNAHYLWLISEGVKPGPDFFCTYPVLFYLFIAPVFRLFPETAYVLLALRLLSVTLFVLVGYLFYRHGRRATGDWMAALFAPVLLASSTSIGPFLVEFSIDHAASMLAVGAMAVMFRPATFRTVAASAALCVLSVAVTPKYAYGLFFGLLGHVSAHYLDTRKTLKVLTAIALGAAAAVALVLAFYWGNGISLSTNVRTAFVLTAKLATNRDDVIGQLGQTVLVGLYLQPLFGGIVLLGVAGWLKRSLRRVDSVTLAGAGIFFGTLLFCLRTAAWFEQYQNVAFVSLAVFAPFAFSWIWDDFTAKALRFAFAAFVAVAVVLQVPEVAREFQRTNLNYRDNAFQGALVGPPAFASLSFTDFLLTTIPRDDRVVAVWVHHPLFRRDLMPVSTDDRPSLSSFMAPDDPSRVLFDAENFRKELSRRPPALIDLNQMGENYPPGWAEVAKEYLIQNQSRYTPMQSLIVPEFFFFIRQDLLPQNPD